MRALPERQPEINQVECLPSDRRQARPVYAVHYLSRRYGIRTVYARIVADELGMAG